MEENKTPDQQEITEIRGIKIKDYHDIGIPGLEEIIALNEQEKEQVKRLLGYIEDNSVWIMPTVLKQLLDDIASHTDYCQRCIDEILEDMERSTAKED